MAGLACHDAITTGHRTAHPTKIKSSQTLFYVEGKAVLVEGDKIVPHAYRDDRVHDGVVIATGDAIVYIEGKKAIQIGDRVSCGDTVSHGSSLAFTE